MNVNLVQKGLGLKHFKKIFIFKVDWFYYKFVKIYIWSSDLFENFLRYFKYLKEGLDAGYAKTMFWGIYKLVCLWSKSSVVTKTSL